MIIIVLIYSSLCIKTPFPIQEEINLSGESTILNRLNQVTIELYVFLEYQACKLAPDIGHLSGKFEGFDWWILSLTGHVDWALPLWREIKIFSIYQISG